MARLPEAEFWERTNSSPKTIVFYKKIYCYNFQLNIKNNKIDKDKNNFEKNIFFLKSQS